MLTDFAYPDRQRLIRPSLLDRAFVFLTTIPDFGDQPMTEPTLTYNTTDGRCFDDHVAAMEHQALVNKIDRFMTEEQVGDSRKKNLRQMLIRWTTMHENTKTEYPAQEAA